MSRLIDGDALMPKLKFIREAEHQIYGKESWGFASKCITAIEDAPTIEERKTGKWEGTLLVKNSGRVKCSECYAIYAWDTQAKYFKFCPNCGADMRGEQDERHREKQN